MTKCRKAKKNMSAQDAGASYYFGIYYGKGLLHLQQVRDRWMFFFFSSRLSYLPFLMPHLLGDG